MSADPPAGLVIRFADKASPEDNQRRIELIRMLWPNRPFIVINDDGDEPEMTEVDE